MNHVRVADLSSESDSRAILLLLSEYAKDIMGGGMVLPESTRTHLIDELRKRPTCHVVLGFVDDLPAGLAICFEAFSTFTCRPILNIHDVSVASSFRGRGLSKEILSMVEEVARDLGCGKMTLEVLEGNEIARRLYSGFGFNSGEPGPQGERTLFCEKRLGMTDGSTSKD